MPTSPPTARERDLLALAQVIFDATITAGDVDFTRVVTDVNACKHIAGAILDSGWLLTAPAPPAELVPASART